MREKAEFKLDAYKFKIRKVVDFLGGEKQAKRKIMLAIDDDKKVLHVYAKLKVNTLCCRRTI